MTDWAIDRLVDALRNVGSDPRERNGSWRARCPAHQGQSIDSLAIKGIEGQALLHCHAGCDLDAVLDALNLARRDLYDEPRGATYNYSDGRVVHRSPDKRFHQSGNTKGTAELYRLAKVRAAAAFGSTIYWSVS